jgi:CBS domain-containing protein
MIDYKLTTPGVETIAEDDTLVVAAKKLASAEVGALPVCDRSGNVRGIITDRDIVVEGIARGKDPSIATVGEIENLGITPHKIGRLPVIIGEEITEKMSTRL